MLDFFAFMLSIETAILFKLELIVENNLGKLLSMIEIKVLYDIPILDRDGDLGKWRLFLRGSANTVKSSWCLSDSAKMSKHHLVGITLKSSPINSDTDLRTTRRHRTSTRTRMSVFEKLRTVTSREGLLRDKMSAEPCLGLGKSNPSVFIDDFGCDLLISDKISI